MSFQAENRDFRNPNPARHLVFIGFDGWGGAYVSRADMPTVKLMMREGASSLKGWNVLPNVSWPNWSSLFSGIPPEFRADGIDPGTGALESSIFTVLEASGKAAGFFYEWDSLDAICTDTAAYKQRIVSNRESAMNIAAYIRERKPVFTAVCFNEPDGTGHKKGWGSKAYYAALSELDALTAIIEQAVRDAGIHENTVFVLSADHGGTFRGHGYNIKKQRFIPLVFYGKNVKRGYVIASAEICDIAPTMAALLGLETPPEWKGRILREIFE